MAERKYRTEFALESVLTLGGLFQEARIEGLLEAAGHDIGTFHIYLIGRRPRVGFKPSSLSATKEALTGILTKQRGTRFEELPFQVPNSTGYSDGDGIAFECPYPHSELVVKDRHGQVFAEGSAALLAGSWHPQLAEWIAPLEVLYVGQAYGDGDRSATDRLVSHSTLQKINGQCLKDSPDQDVWLYIMRFALNSIVSVDYRTKDVQIDGEADDQHTADVLAAGVSEAHVINYTEAALIRYFEPAYNKMFKDNFPDAKHKSYSECYELEAVSKTLKYVSSVCRSTGHGTYRRPVGSA